MLYEWMNTTICIMNGWTLQSALWRDEHISLLYNEVTYQFALRSDVHTTKYNVEMNTTVCIMKRWAQKIALWGDDIPVYIMKRWTQQ
jgi:hypothetical protein